MSKLLTGFIYVSILFGLTACSVGFGGGSNDSGGQDSSQIASGANKPNPCATRSTAAKDWSTYLCYDYHHNECDTGKHEFPSISEYCTGLADENLNHGCDSEARSRDYQKECSTN